MKFSLQFTIPIFVILLISLSCKRKEVFTTDTSDKLEFSLDTLTFDTVFTTVGSATRILKIFNPHKKSIRIDKISIENGNDSKFRINIDGIPGATAENIEIAPEDSLYIFGEVTVDPDQDISISPFVIEDALIFETNGNTQKVVLEAWGQNANYIPNRYYNGKVAYLSCDFGEEVWDDPKPYVIYGVLVVDSCDLVLPPGMRLYMHGGIAKGENTEGERFYYNDGLIFFLKDGHLKSQGTLDNPVVIRTDRLEHNFDEVPGQWAGIRFNKESKGNTINYTEILNPIVGVSVDSAASLSIKNSRIGFASGSGILGIHSKIDAENCLIYRTNGNSVQLEYGGEYTFDYCTMASYGVDETAIRVTNLICRNQLCTIANNNDLKAHFRNSIIFGSREDEVDLVHAIVDGEDKLFDYKFENCIYRVKKLPTEEGYMDFFDHSVDCQNANTLDPLFFDVEENDYHLDTLSIAEEKGKPIGIDIDLDGNPRDGTNPDIGCFEYSK